MSIQRQPHEYKGSIEAAPASFPNCQEVFVKLGVLTGADELDLASSRTLHSRAVTSLLKRKSNRRLWFSVLDPRYYSGFAYPTMSRAPSVLTLRALRSFILPARPIHSQARLAIPIHSTRTLPRAPFRSFSVTPSRLTTLNQVRNGCRKPQKKRRSLSPAMVGRPEMKGVCLKVGITKPKKPNSGQRKTAKIRLSNGRIISAYIPGEGVLLESC